jgi:Domain of unknown function (DUF2027)
MNFNIGDKVKFLNSKGGGVIRKILDSRMVSVAVEGGFEIPTLISELIRMEESEPAARFFNENQDVRIDPEKQQAKKDEDILSDRLKTLPTSIIRNRKSEDVFLAFIPHEQKWLISGLMDIILINSSSFDILYNLFLQNPDNDYTGKDYGSCFPDSSLLLDTITREQVPEWTSGYIQFLFHKSLNPEVLPPFNSQFKISGQKFYNEASYKETPFISGKTILIKIVSITEYFKSFKSKPEKVVTRSTHENENLIMKHQVNQREAEVDLHIHELMEDPVSLENNEILDFQKNYFERCLESAIANHFLKITFIHGVGNGILREVILEILKKYKGVEVLDAPMQKYGIGAVEIRIPHNF